MAFEPASQERTQRVPAAERQAGQQEQTFIWRLAVASVLGGLGWSMRSGGTIAALTGSALVLAGSFIVLKAVRRSESILPVKWQSKFDSVGDSLNAHVVRFSERHIEPGLLAEIAPDMRDRLHEEGRQLVFTAPLATIGMLAIVNFLMVRTETGGFFYGGHDLVLWSVSLILLVLVLLTLPQTLRVPLDREVQFRRQHGKWRWER
ncbi:hypothetical protein [Dongia sp. agr-C8]